MIICAILKDITPEGQHLNCPRPIKNYLLENQDTFTPRLITNSLEYSAGHELSRGDELLGNELVNAKPNRSDPTHIL
ncbi:MAG: hypothetical protein HN457_01460 [Opitutales bacterium]|nr:hypothetical protein [Opitutales bacterium]MBT5169181.1 hypothetical protein [Opitutales bacterium]MBT6769927.1 hypothetical protein [Opitutales bacterium]